MEAGRVTSFLIFIPKLHIRTGIKTCIEFLQRIIDLNYQKDTTSGQEGLDLISAIKQHDESLPVIAMTGYSSIQIAVDAMKLGAADFVQKPWTNERLVAVVNRAIKSPERKQRSAAIGAACRNSQTD